MVSSGCGSSHLKRHSKASQRLSQVSFEILTATNTTQTTDDLSFTVDCDGLRWI